MLGKSAVRAASDARVAAGLGDDGAAVGVAHEDRLAVEVVEDLFGGGHVARQGHGRFCTTATR
jgi:hypothetical protein